MAISKCIKCNSTYFELKEANIANCNYKHFFVQCASCGAVIGVIPYYETNVLLEKLANRLGVQLT